MATGGVTFSGSGQDLIYTGGSIITAYPYSIAVWLASSQTLGVAEEFVAGLGSSTNDVLAGAVYGSNGGERKIAYDRTEASGTATSFKSASPHVNTSLQLMLVVFTSAASRTVYFADNTGTTDTSNIGPQNFSHFDRFTIGTAQRGSGKLLPAACTVAEVHVFDAALTSSDFTTLLTTPPEDLTDWVDGWTLSSNSDLTSIGGTRTLTATGSPTTASLTLPYTRSSGAAVGSGLSAGKLISGGPLFNGLVR